jgi:hypothetical protein
MGNDFRAAYVPGSPLKGAGQTVGLLQFDGYNTSDIAYYESQAGLPSVPLSNVLLDGFTGSPTGSGGEVEVCLDIEAAISMAPGLAGVIVYMAGPYGSFHDVLNRMATDNLAKQLSCSWYIPGGGPDAVADQIFQQMAAQGQSFFNASGDYDAFSGPVDFPGETPYIVQVGGTTLTTSGPGGGWVSEKVWNWGGGIGSGGGISTRYGIPSYQTNISMTLNQGSTGMRNIPDVALTADNVYVRANGRDYNVGGTSCAAPLWAGFMALVNQQAVGGGRPVVGFINPAVDTIATGSSYTSCFHDITTGDNTRSGSLSRFYAVVGYDLCTGWGTPGGQSLINSLAIPDALLISPSALAFSGGVGGPFSPNPGWLTLTNSGTNGLSWTLVNTSVWFNVSPTSGTLLPGGAAASVSVSVGASAGALPPGVYAAVVAFTNQTSGVAQSVSLALSVAGLSMADDFEPDIDLSQWSGFGGVLGGTVLATNYGGSVSAPNALWFGNAGSRFATTIPINTSGGGQIGFCIRLANGSAWPWAQVDDLPAEGVVLECSTNGGGSWTVLGNYDTPAYYNWTGVVLPIPAAAQAPAALFRWRQLSNSGTNYDHWALDNVVVGTGSMAPRIVMDPQSQNAAVGDPAGLNVAAVGSAPLSYQWLLNGSNISGATASSLVWTNVQLTDAGTYSVLVSNSVGSVTSSNAVLTPYVPVCAPPPAGLVSWWAADADASDSFGTNNGVLLGGAVIAGGRVGQAFCFTNGSGYVQVPASPDWALGTSDFSIELWAKFTSLGGSRAFIADDQGGGTVNKWIFWLNNGQLQLHLYSSALGVIYLGSGAFSPVLDHWHHVAVTRSGSVFSFYVDGVLNSTAASSVGIPSANAPLTIGEAENSFFLGGLEDEIAIYNRALGLGEIQAIYYAGGAGKCNLAPTVQTQPQSQTAPVGANVALSVAAAGRRPLTYQWLFNGTNLMAATNSLLTLTNVQFLNSGTYAVVVTNAYGAITSSNAILSVYVPVCVPSPAGLVSWWAAEGSAADLAGTNNGVLLGGADFASGEVGQAFDFSNGSGYVQVPASPSWALGTSDFSIELWAKFTSLGGSRAFIADDQGGGTLNKWIFWLNNGQLQLHLYSSSLGVIYLGSGTFSPVLNRWHHLAVTRSASLFSFYVDGALNSTAASSVAIPNANAPLTIGEAENSFFMGGLEDEIAVYNRALGADEIQAIYNAGSAGKCQPTVAPSILTQPQSQTAAVGANASFAVGAAGTPPFSYQWQFNGTNIGGATSSVLALTNVQLTQAGSYTVQVTNFYGSATSSNALLTVNPASLCVTPPAGLVSWWAAERDASDSLGTNNGSLQGGASFGSGEVGQAFDFSNGSGYVQVPASPSWALGTKDFSIELWVKFASLGGSRAFVADDQGGGMVNKWIFWLNNGQLQLHLYSSALGVIYLGFGAFSPVLNHWHHVAVTRSGSLFSFYVDGALNSTAASSVAIPNANAPLTIGEAENSFFLGGLEDEIAIYNRALGSGEIAAIYNAGAAGKCGLPPVILKQPQSQTVAVGANASFAVGAAGTPPFSYQWQFNGTSIGGATSSVLALTNVQPTQAGSYTIQVTSLYGSATSSNAILTINPAPPCAPPPSGLVSWWRGEGDCLDAIGTNNGTLQNGATFAAGLVGQSFAFDGVNDYVKIPRAAGLDVGGQVTIDFWMKADPSSPIGSRVAGLVGSDYYGMEIGTAQAGVYLFVSTDGGATFVTTADANGGGASFPTGEWHHVAGTCDGARLQFYLDGQPWGKPTSVTGTISAMLASSFVTIGSEDGRTRFPFCIGTRYFNGLVDEVDIFNRALSASEIAAIYNAGAAGKCAPRPVILTPPQSQTIECSSNVTFSVTATGLSPLAYQWYFGSNSILSATNTLLTLANVGLAQAGNYSVVVTNALGSATGGPAVLTVVDTVPPTILSCASNHTLSVGVNCTASLPDLTGEVVATDASGPVTVTQSPPAGTQLPLGVTNVTFTVRDSSSNASLCASIITVADTTPPFVMACVLELTLDFDANCQALLPDLTSTNYIVASDNCSSVSVAQAPPARTALPAGTNTVLLTVSDSASNQTTRAVAVIVPGEPHIVVQPADLALAVSSNATFSVLACGAAPLFWQWQHSNTNLPGATNAVLTLSNIKTNDAGDYRVVITNPAGSNTSAVATLTVLRPPVITRQPRSLAAAPGGAASFSVSAQGGTPFSYQWQRDGSPLVGQTKGTLSITNVQPQDFGAYTVGITNLDGWVLSDAAILTLAASPVTTSLSFNSDTFMLTVPTELGPTYVVEYKDSVDDPSWKVLTTLAGTGLPIPITDNGLTNTTRFYRVRVR